MNRRDVLKSSAYLTGGLAVAGIPINSYAEEPVPVPIPKVTFNANILNAYRTSSQTAIAPFKMSASFLPQFFGAQRLR